VPEAQTWRQASGTYVLGVCGGPGGSFAQLWYMRTKHERDKKVSELFDDGTVVELSFWTCEGRWLGTETRMRLDG